MNKPPFFVIALTILFALLSTLPAAAQDPAPNPGLAMQSLETKLEATETLEPQLQQERIDLEFRANITLGANGVINPSTEALRIAFDYPTPCFIVFIPGGCFTQGPNGYRARDPQGCGVSLRLEFPSDPNQPPIDLTAGLLDLDARLAPVSEGGGVWNLRMAVSFLDTRQAPQPCFLTILGGAGRTIVRIGDDVGDTKPHRLSVAGDSQ